MYQIKPLLTSLFVCLLFQYGTYAQQKKKSPTTTTNTATQTVAPQPEAPAMPKNVSVKQSTGPQNGASSFKAEKNETRDGRFGVPEEIAPDRFGVRAGIGQIFLFDGQHSDWIPTFEAGAFANIGFTPNSRFQPEINYRSIATKKATLSSHINMVQIPLLYQYRFGYDEQSFFVEIGPYVSYLASLSFSLNSTTSSVDLGDLSFGDRTEVGAIVGAGYRIDKRWFVNARANYGLKKVKDFNNYTTVTLGVGYGF